MKDKVMNGLQKFSKGIFVPVLFLPIVGILIAIGSALTNARLAAILPFLTIPLIKNFGLLLSGSLVPILSNLGLVFCVGIAIGMSNEKKTDAALTSMLVYIVFINAMNKYMGLYGMLVPADALRGSGQAAILGVQCLDMGVFLGIILGTLTAYIHNKLCNKEFGGAFQIYGGSKFVFIVMIPVTVVLAVILTHVWPVIQGGISALGLFITSSGNFGILMYGALERLLIPTGLHHLVYTPFLYTSLGGSAEVAGKLYEGARNIYFAEMADPNVLELSKSVIWDARGVSKMFGLVGACLAIYHTARPENKLKVKAILIPAVMSSVVAGVTEPIEFSFMFVAPILFVIHALLSGTSMVLLNLLGSRAIGPNGIIDFLLYNLPLGIAKTHWPVYVLVGVIMFAVYYLIFRFFITKFNLKTLGREDDAKDMKLYSKKEYNAKKNTETQTAKQTATQSDDEVAPVIIEALGGAGNIQSVENCATRLRLVLEDTAKVNENLLKSETGAVAVIIKGKNVQVIYGVRVGVIRAAVDRALGRG